MREIKVTLVALIEKNIALVDKSLNDRIETILKESED